MVKQRPYLFPDPESADPTGLVTITQNISPDLILLALRQGIFPWSEDPVRWYSPDPRAVFVRDHIKFPRNLDKIRRRSGFTVTCDQNFRQIIEACAQTHGQDERWITQGFIDNYTVLHELGYAHSLEVWQEGHLVGGLYGVQMGQVFSGESMFHTVSNASKIAFHALVEHLYAIDIRLIDAQVVNEHTYNLGALLVPRRDYLKIIKRLVSVPTLFEAKKWPKHPWTLPKKAPTPQKA